MIDAEKLRYYNESKYTNVRERGWLMKQLYTRWGKKIDPEHVLSEYPRPLLVRDSYINLNGYWEYAFTDAFQKPEKYDGKILVPFSPEAVLSGVNRQLQPEEYLWYRRTIDVNEVQVKKHRLILHFGAVDQACVVYVNGHQTGRHTGGYLPFELDITDAVHDGANELTVAVKDRSDTSYHTRGKQKLKAGGMFYTAQSGIWQTVWMEYVPEVYITELEAIPDIDRNVVRICVHASEPEQKCRITVHKAAIYPEPMKCSEDVFDMFEIPETVITETKGNASAWIEIPVPDARLWTCEEPYLYYYKVTMGEDQIISYFAMQKFSLEPDAETKGFPRICLNGKEQFQNGVLDQGYWPEGLYTPPCDEAFIFDITEMKKTGFNMVRKHIKIEPQRWYYHCDRLGIVVWQDMVNGGERYKHWFVTYLATVMSWLKIPMRDIYPRLLSRKNKAGRLEFVREMRETVYVLKGHPSIASWVIFNEGWGQFQTEDMTRLLREMDPDRLIDQASGWFDQGGGDFSSLHNYFFGLFIRPERKRASALSEYGGYSYPISGHTACEKQYGYGACKTREELNKRCTERADKMRELISEGLCASVYTQWSDIEEEVNGVYTYDRKIRKIDRV